MSNHRRVKNLLVSVTLSGALAACGGGGGGDGEGGSNRISGNFSAGSEVSQSEFDIFTETGVWRTQGGFDYSATQNYNDVKVDVDLEATLTSVTSIQFNSENDVVVRECDEYGPEQVGGDYFDDEDFFDEEDEDFSFCETYSNKYYKMSSSSYGLEVICDSEVFASFEFTKLSNTANMNFGSLSFTSNTYSDLNANDSVCGGFDAATIKADYEQPNRYNAEDSETKYGILSFGALYGSSAVYFEFEVEGDLKTGTYNVVDYISEGAANEMTAYVSSGEFGGSSTFAQDLYGASGTVTIQSINSTSATGTFEITTFSGATFTGSFSFNLN